MGDIPDWCCAAGVCCDRAKQVDELAKILRDRVEGLTERQAREAAEALADNLDMLPKAAGLHNVVAYVQAHPYR